VWLGAPDAPEELRQVAVEPLFHDLLGDQADLVDRQVQSFRARRGTMCAASPAREEIPVLQVTTPPVCWPAGLRSECGQAEAGSEASALFGQTLRCSARRAGPRCFSVTAIQPQASQAISLSAAFRARRVRAASPAGQSCSSNSRTAQRSEGRSQRRPHTPQDATPGLSSADSASSRRFALPPVTDRLYRPRERSHHPGDDGSTFTRLVSVRWATCSCALPAVSTPASIG